VPPPNSLRQLHLVYAFLDTQPPSALTDDLRKSLLYYRGELTLLALLPVPDETPIRVTNWLLNLLELETFVAREGRWPRENRRLDRSLILEDERQLAAWIRTQRIAAGQGARCTYQLDRLECVDGFRWQPLDDRWHNNADTYQLFTDTHKRAPSLHSDDQTERTLAGFATRARSAHRRGRLTATRIGILEELDFWTWGATR
jgi:hypothetical protein